MTASCPTCYHEFQFDNTASALTCPLCEASVPIPQVRPRSLRPFLVPTITKRKSSRNLWARFAGIGLFILAAFFAICGGICFLLIDHITEPDFIRMDSAAGQFSVEFPGKHYTANPVTWGPAGIVHFPMVGYERVWPSEHYMVAWIDIPPENLALGEGVILDEAINGASAYDVSIIKIDRREEITIDGHPGREVVFSTSHTCGKSIMRVTIAHKRLYILFVGGHFIQDDSDRAKRFLNSLRFR